MSLACSVRFLFARVITVLGAVSALSALHARVDLLLVPPPENLPAAAPLTLTLYLNNPTDRADRIVLPRTLEADYATNGRHGRARFSVEPAQPARGFEIAAGDFRVVTLRLDAPLEPHGDVISLRLTTPATNAIMFRRARPAPPVAAEPVPPAEAGRRRGRWLVGEHFDLTSDIENMRRHISGYDPIYFAVGWRERFNARFQFSFKFRVFEDRGEDYPEPWWKKRFRELHFAYTQTSIWDLESFSKPFYDSSYKPTIFLLQKLPSSRADLHFTIQSGGQHESNGKAGSAASVRPGGSLLSAGTSAKHPLDTRSFNTLYVMPRVRWEPSEGGFLEASARLSGYFHHDENDDIEQYRGNVELTLRGGLDRGPQLSLHLRGRPDGHGSAEFNLTWPANQTPLLKNFAPSLGGYAQIQYFNGYGESLLDYDVRRRDQLRFGLMIVR